MRSLCSKLLKPIAGLALISLLGSAAISIDLLLRPPAGVVRFKIIALTATIGSSLLATLLLVGLGRVIIRCNAHPIQQLSAAAQAIAKGNLNQRVEIDEPTGATVTSNRDEISTLMTTFNNMAAELRGLYSNLEAEVEARTRESTVAAEIARAVSSSLELEVVLQRSVQLIHQRLGFDQVGIFIIEPDSDVAVLREAINKQGDAVRMREPQIPLKSKSLVGVAAATGRPRIVQDVTIEPFYPKTPLLVGTRSAAAIPLQAGDLVVGVLDAQSGRSGTFTPEMIGLLSTLANQIAVGVQNARLYTQQRETAERLAKVDQLKTQFLTTMSHGLRTPLNSIIGFSRLLLDGEAGPLTEAQSDELNIIHSESQHLLRLINDILDISQINAGKMKLNLEEVDLREIVDSVMSTAIVLIKDKPIHLYQDVAPDLPTVYADRMRVRQMLLNLLSNATKFTAAGQISIRVQPIEAFSPHTERLETFVEVSVSDTGIGIPQDKQEHIFKEFTQVDDSITSRFRGPGLGLPITKKLVELHGGWIQVKSQPREGSTFTVILPITRPEWGNEVFFGEVEARGAANYAARAE